MGRNFRFFEKFLFSGFFQGLGILNSLDFSRILLLVVVLVVGHLIIFSNVFFPRRFFRRRFGAATTRKEGTPLQAVAEHGCCTLPGKGGTLQGALYATYQEGEDMPRSLAGRSDKAD